MTTEVKTNDKAAKPSLSIETAVKSIHGAMLMGRKALNTELAVCLAIFAAEGNAEANTKAMVVEVYVKGGYDAANSNSRHYKTVNRRVNAAAGLFTMIGVEKVWEWVGQVQEDKMIPAILKGLDEYKFNSMDDVLEFCGRPNNRTTKQNAQGAEAGKGPEEGKGTEEGKGEEPKSGDQAPAEGAAAAAGAKEAPKTMRFSVGRVRVELPETMGAEDMVKLASKILDAARKKEQAELQASLAHISTAPSPVAAKSLH